MAPTKAQELLKDVNAALGKDALMFGSNPYFDVTYLSTGIPPIDDLLHGGLPYGRFVEIFGDYSTLKSWVGLKAIAACQKSGGVAALIDTEHAYDPKWARECGVDVSELVLKQPPNGETAMDTVEILLRGGVNLIVFDSVAATLPRAEEELKLSGDKNNQPARLASLMSLAMRKLTAANKKTAMLWINQTRINVGVMFGSNEAVPGGKALPFYASYRIAFRKAGRVTEKVPVNVMKDGKPTKAVINQTIAQSIRATVEKSKLNAPYRDVMFNFDFRNGAVDTWWYYATQALDIGAIEYSRGDWWVNSKNGTKTKKYRGREAFQEAVGEKELLKTLGRLNGAPQLDKSKAVSVKRKSSKNGAQKSTQTQVRAGSKKMVRIKKRSSKSKTR